MQNFSIEINNEIYWISRSVAVAGFIFSLKNGQLCVLANERGIGSPNYTGLWNCPCGYLDYNEHLKDACCREIREETNVFIEPYRLNEFGVDDTLEGHQNITFRYWYFDSKLAQNQKISAEHAEPNEVADIAWINIDELDDYIWAFNHKRLIQSIAYTCLKRYLTRSQRKRLKGILF